MATKANLIIDQGSTYSTDIYLVDDNDDSLLVNDYTVASQMRKTYTSLNAISFSTSTNASIGTITLSLTANQSGAIPAGRYVYDVELTDIYTGTVSRVVEGIVTVTPQVTR
jgi:hypothetical protein